MHGGDIYNNSVDIDFSVNLNPYRDPEVMRVAEEAAKEGIALSGTYPDIDQTAVRKALADAEGIDASRLFAGNGASELIMASVHAISPDRALLVDPCFGGYGYALESARECRIDHYNLKEENGFAVTADVAGVIDGSAKLVFLADPNNPTGKNIDDDVLSAILDRADEKGVAVILDQSFFMLSDKYLKCTHEYVSDLLNRYENLYIIRSYTKCFALPGIRMGYVMSSEDNVNNVRRQIGEWNISSVSTALMRSLSGIAKQRSFFEDSVKMISSERDFLSDGLSRLGYTVFDSNTDFLLIKSEEDIYEKLLSRRILVRRCDDLFRGCKGFFRIAIRGHEDNMKLIDLLSK